MLNLEMQFSLYGLLDQKNAKQQKKITKINQTNIAFPLQMSCEILGKNNAKLEFENLNKKFLNFLLFTAFVSPVILKGTTFFISRELQTFFCLLILCRKNR